MIPIKFIRENIELVKESLIDIVQNQDYSMIYLQSIAS